MLDLPPYRPTTLPETINMIATEPKRRDQYRTFNERITFWIGPIHKELFERAGETLGINRSVLARRMFYFLDKPREEIIELFGKDVDGYKHPPKAI